METKQYKNTFVNSEDEFPKIASTCPRCEGGLIFASKWGGVYCGACKWKWLLSKFVKKDTPEAPKTPQGGLNIIYDDIMLQFRKQTEAHKILNDNIKIAISKLNQLTGQ